MSEQPQDQQSTTGSAPTPYDYPMENPRAESPAPDPAPAVSPAEPAAEPITPSASPEPEPGQAPFPAGTGEPSEPAPDPTGAGSSSPAGAGAAEPAGDEPPGSDLPKTMAEATMGDDPDKPLSSVSTHPSVLVRLRDVYAHVENWAARHPEIARFIAADLKSSLSTAERVNEAGGAEPVGDVQVPDEPETEPAS